MPFFWVHYHNAASDTYEHVKGPVTPSEEFPNAVRLSWEADTAFNAIGRAAIATRRDGRYIAFRFDMPELPTVTTTTTQLVADSGELNFTAL